MDSSTRTVSPERFLEWIKEKKGVFLQGNALTTEHAVNLTHARELKESHAEAHQEVEEFASHLDKLLGTENKDVDKITMEASYSALKELSKERQKCLETLLYIAEIEEYYQTLAAEVDMRALQLCTGACPADDANFVNNKEQGAGLSKTYNACMYAVRNTWSWLGQASKCMETHLQNASEYHQFFHEIKHCDQGMKALTSRLKHDGKKDQKDRRDIQSFIREVRDTTRQLLDYQAKVELLFDRSADVVPLHLRKEPVEEPLSVTALCDYQQKDFSVSEGEVGSLLDNSEVTKWRVRTESGREALVPAIVFLIPPPDKDAVVQVQRVRNQLLSTWKDCLLILKKQARKYFNKALSEKSADDIQCLNPGQRKEISQCLTDMVETLRTGTQEGVEFRNFKSVCQDWKRAIDKMQGVTVDRKNMSHALQVQWKSNQKLLRHIEELGAYATAFDDYVSSTRGSHHHLMKDRVSSSEMNFVSKAYIERLKPVELEHLLPRDINRDAVIRHVTMAEKLPVPAKKRHGKGSTWEEWTVQEHELNPSEQVMKLEEEYSSQTIRETETFVITGVIDPRTNDRISIYQAIQDGIISQTQGVFRNPTTGETMPIPEAMSKGLILVEFTNRSVERDAIERGIITTTTERETISYTVRNVFDPVSGKPISIAEAVERGLIDARNGLYVDPITGKSIPISQAVDMGLVDVKTVDTTRNDAPDGKAPQLDKDIVILGVTDPTTGREISLERAVREGIVDLKNGMYIDKASGESIPLVEALHRSLLRARLAEPEDTDNVVKAKILQISGGKVPVVETMDQLLASNQMSEKPLDIKTAIFERLKERLNPKLGGVREQLSGKDLTIQEAFDQGILEVSPLRIKNADGDSFTLQEAAITGLLNPHTAKEILRAIEPHSLGQLIADGCFDPATGEYIDPRSGKRMSVKDAVAGGLLDADMVFYTEGPSHTIMTLGSAIDDRKFDPISGKFVDPRTGASLSPEEAIAANVVNPHIDAQELSDQISSLRLLRAFMDTSSTGVRDPRTGEDISVEAAVRAGLLDVPRIEYHNLATDQILSIPEAVDAKLIEPKTAKKIYGAMSKNSLGEAIAQGQIDPNTGKFVHPDTKRKIAIKDAVEAGLLDPSTLFLVDPNTNQVTTLGEFIAEGRFNPQTGKFKDPLTNLEISIANAIKKGIVGADIDPNQFIEEKLPVQELLDSGKISASKAVFVAPNGQEMPLKEALSSGFLTPASLVKIDPKTGHVKVADDGSDIVKALMDTKQTMDWLTAMETSVASQSRPSEDLADLEEQIKAHQDMKKDIKTKEDSVEQLLERAQQLVENNKVKDGAKESGNQQQIQRLKFNINDLKNRFDGVGNQLDSRLQRLDGMRETLEEVTDNADSLEGWLDDTSHELGDIRRSVAATDDMDGLLEAFKEFNNNALAKEDQIQRIAKAATSFKDKAKDYGREADKYSRSLQQKIPKTPPPPKSLLESEVNRVNDRFKDVVGECTAMMAKLTETAAKNKEYADLRERLAASLPEMEARVAACRSAPAAHADPQEQLASLQALTNDVIAEGKPMEDLRAVGGELLAILEALDCADTPKAKEIEATIEALSARYDAVQEEVVDRQHQVARAIAESQDVHHALDGLLSWIVETEALFDNLRPLSLDRDQLTEQVQAHRVLVSDIEAHRARVGVVAEQCRGTPGADAKCEQLVDRFDILESRAEQRGAELEDVTQKIGALHANVTQLEAWLGNAVQSLKRDSSDFDPGSLKDKIESLYGQKRARQGDLDAIKRAARELIDDPNTGDKNRLKETVADTQGKWHDLTELLVQMISFAALREIDDLLKYLDKAENEINTAEPTSTDPETLAVQLRDHRVFHDDLESKRQAVNETIDKCNRMLRETTNDEADDIKNKLDTIRSQADLVCKLSNERLALLEEALPLASHFSETHADLQSWLGEIEAEIQSLEVPADANPEQIRKQLDNAKTTQRIIDDHKPLVEDLAATGHELMEMCTDEDASDLKEDVDTVNSKYDEVKVAVREKVAELDEALRSVTTDVADTVDGLLEELHYLHDQVEHADPIAANPDALREQISENKTVIDDLTRRNNAIAAAREAVKNALDQISPDNAEDLEDVRTKLQDIDTLQENIRQGTQERTARLDEALAAAEMFTNEHQEAIRALRDIQDNLLSQDSPGVDPSTVQEQERELEAIREELSKAQRPIEACRKSAEVLENLCGTPGRMELQKHMEDLEAALEEIDEGVKERGEELASAEEKAEKFDNTLHAIMSWLPKAEDQIKNMSPVAADPRSVRIQIEELKVFNLGVKPHYEDIQALNQCASELKSASPVTAESLTPQVKEVNERWGKLLGNMNDREQHLKDTMVTLGEVDHAMDDVIGFLQQTESDLQQMDDIYGDPKLIETHLKKLQMLQKDLKNQEPSINKLNKAVKDMAERSGGKAVALQDKADEMNGLFKDVKICARDRQNQLQDILKEAKAFMGDVEDLIRWCSEFKMQLRSSGPMGALPDTAQRQFEKFMNDFATMERKEGEVQALLLNGEDMISRCREEDTRQLRDNLRKLNERMYDTREKAERKRRKMEEHLANVKDFHAMLKIHTDWLSNAEKILGTFKHPSKLVERVLAQIHDHKEFKQDIEAHREIMQNLDRTGTYLKYFGRKQDTVYIKNLLISIKLRWKKLVRRADEKGRLLQQAHKEDKRFYDAWKGLCDWLDDSEKKLKRYTTAAPAKVKQDIDDLKIFQHQLSSKHPAYYSTMRLGRSLKDRCTKSDPEREVLQSMLEELKNKWTVIRSIMSQRQNKLDEALLSSGRFADAIQSLMEWLTKAEAYLSEDQPILGDLDTVNILIEQHKAFQQELESRQGMVAAMKAAPGVDRSLGVQIDELSNVWDRVSQLSDVREARLLEALKLADEFNDAVQVVREWLPTAEQELKFKALPESEEAIVNLIESHEKFQEELQGYQPNVERIRFLAEEILSACHPNAIRFVKYYLTITQTRWEQAINRSNQRSQRLQDALRNLRGNAALLEELLAWLTEAQALLAAKERDPIPEDLTVVEALAKEHLEFHEDLAQKNRDVEKLTKVPSSRDGSGKRVLGAQYGSSWSLKDGDSPSPRVTTLQNRWRNVWRMSVDRKKKLQDCLDNLLELESFKNFDFELWRQRYISWIRAKKLRITDFFRRQDKDGDGSLNRQEFVDGMLASKFPTNRTELNAVFDIFDRNRSGELDYREFVDALRPERQRGSRSRGKKPATDAELIHDEIEQQVSKCQCRHQFKSNRVGEGKYKFGDKQKLCLVRFLNNTVMVRVGGGWTTLAEFLEQNDPCRAIGRRNSDLREALMTPESALQMRAALAARRRASAAPHTNGSPAKGHGSLTNSPSASLGNSNLSGSTSSLASGKSGSSLGGGSTPARGGASNKRSNMAKSWSNLSSAGLPSPIRGGGEGMGYTRRDHFGSMTNLNNGTPRRGSTSSTSSQTSTTTTPRRGSRPPQTPGSYARGTAASHAKTTTPTHSGSKTPSGGRSRSPGPGSPAPSGGAPAANGRKTPSGQRSRSPASRPAGRRLSSTPKSARV